MESRDSLSNHTLFLSRSAVSAKDHFYMIMNFRPTTDINFVPDPEGMHRV